MAVFTSRRGGGGMARWLVLAVIGVSFLLGWLTLVGQRAGVYNPEVGVALLAVATVSIFAPLLWWQARARARGRGPAAGRGGAGRPRTSGRAGGGRWRSIHQK
jgi:hypothetical protein